MSPHRHPFPWAARFDCAGKAILSVPSVSIQTRMDGVLYELLPRPITTSSWQQSPRPVTGLYFGKSSRSPRAEFSQQNRVMFSRRALPSVGGSLTRPDAEQAQSCPLPFLSLPGLALRAEVLSKRLSESQKRLSSILGSDRETLNQDPLNY